jgi:regulator of sigma E protease
MFSTLLAFVVTLGVLIVIHEYGHYWVARRCGVKVLRFSIGFGRPLWKRVAGADRTEWVVAAIPLGGYVRMLDERDHDDAPIDPLDLPRAFNRQPVWKRTAIVLAGPAANLLLAILVYWGLNVVGVMEPKALVSDPVADTPAQRAGFQAGDLVVAVDGQSVRSFNELSWLVLQRAVERTRFDVTIERPEGVPRTLTLDLREFVPGDLDANPLPRVGLRPASSQPRIGKVTEGGAAEVAGLRSGDRVIEIDQHPMRSARDLIDIVRASAEKPLAVVVDREGVQVNLTVIPARARDDKGSEFGRIGAEIGERPPLVKVSYGPVESLALAAGKTWETAAFSLRMLWKMITGEASLKNLSGPVTIADYAGQTARIGPAAFFSFLALVSISLGVLNLLPIPMLDGGHLLYYLIEIIKGSPPADWIVQWGQRAGVGLLFLLTALALYNDLTRLLL